MSNPAQTRKRILDGAVRAVARHGISKLGMIDVSELAGVSRGTLYRYFPTKDALLIALGRYEVARFWERVIHRVNETADGDERVRVMLEQTILHMHEHEALRRLLNTDPAFVMVSLRSLFPTIRDELHHVLAPYLEQAPALANSEVDAKQFTDWMTRFLISMYLFEDPDPQKMVDGVTAMYRTLISPQKSPPLSLL